MNIEDTKLQQIGVSVAILLLGWSGYNTLQTSQDVAVLKVQVSSIDRTVTTAVANSADVGVLRAQLEAVTARVSVLESQQ